MSKKTIEYQAPPPGTILLAASNRDEDGQEIIQNPGPTKNALEFRRWLQAATQNQAWDQNLIRALDYQNQFEHSWLVQYNTGRMKGPTGIVGDPDTVPLQPTAAVVVVVTRQGGFDIQPSGKAEVMGTDDDGEDVAVEFATGPFIPVCPVPEYKKISTPQH